MAVQRARWLAMKNGWFGSFQGLHQRSSTPCAFASSSRATMNSSYCGEALRRRRPRPRLDAGALAARGRAGELLRRAAEDDHHLPAVLGRLLGLGDGGKLVAHAVVAGARRDVAHAAHGRLGEVDAGPVGLGVAGPVDAQAVVGRAHLGQLVAPARELAGDLAGADEARVRLGDADREPAVALDHLRRRRRRVGRRRGGLGARLVAVAAGGEGGSRCDQQRRRGTARPQTADTSSSSATRNEEPQPQAAITLGLSTLKPAPWRLST